MISKVSRVVGKAKTTLQRWDDSSYMLADGSRYSCSTKLPISPRASEFEAECQKAKKMEAHNVGISFTRVIVYGYILAQILKGCGAILSADRPEPIFILPHSPLLEGHPSLPPNGTTSI